MSTTSEQTTVGLSEKAHPILARLKEEGHFLEMVDAYRFAIALAIATDAKWDEALSTRRTVFSVATLDPDKELARAIQTLIGSNLESVYRVAERLAEWGVLEMGIRLEEGRLDVMDLIRQVA